MYKKFLSLAMALALCLGLTIPVSAAENILYLRYKPGENGTCSVEKTDDGMDSALSLAGNVNITGVAANNTEEQAAGQPKLLLYCMAYGPVTLTLMRDSEAIVEARIDAVQTFSAGYLVTEEQPVLIEGKTAMLLNPGKYHVEVRTTEYMQGAQAIIEVVESSVPGNSTGFTDVAASSPYAEAIKWAVDKKITTGKTATTFGPSDTCTVSHILTFLWRGNGRPGESGTERESVAAWAKALGIDTSNLNAPCTRAAAVTYMWKAAGSPASTKTASFADVPAGADFAKAVSWAVEKGITNGTGGDAFSPGGTCTRGQIVTFLYRASK